MTATSLALHHQLIVLFLKKQKLIYYSIRYYIFYIFYTYTHKTHTHTYICKYMYPPVGLY